VKRGVKCVLQYSMIVCWCVSVVHMPLYLYLPVASDRVFQITVCASCACVCSPICSTMIDELFGVMTLGTSRTGVCDAIEFGEHFLL
jgi:hypothetical protein